MIPGPLEYYRPTRWDEARQVFQQLIQAGRTPRYALGGTELITMARTSQLSFSDVIDLKRIPEVMTQDQDGDWITWGAGLPLGRIAALDRWPVLTATVDRVADHTSREHITLGGNGFSLLPYKEAMLPFMLVDHAEATLATGAGLVTGRLPDYFDGTWRVASEDFLVSLRVRESEVRNMRFRSFKLTRLDWIDYPLVTIVAVRHPTGEIRAAFAGWGSAPLVSAEVNRVLSDTSRSPGARAAAAIGAMPVKPLDDVHGSAAYRAFVTEYTLARMIGELEASS
ncbi:MAG: FAD binding domain-containing protein [Firmicutes bacterium]|nr:FAD binding domain-containing protein [Bacillota bacterium]